MSGTVHGGEQPVTGATVQLYATSTSGDGTAAAPLLRVGVTTDSHGGFSITGDYTCPSASALVYLVATGGNPGLPGNKTNPNLALMAALGQCGALNASTFVNLNEVTTVASTFQLAAFAQSYSEVGSHLSDEQILADAFLRVQQSVNLQTGTATASELPSGYSIPYATIDTLANLISACVNSGGGQAGDSSPCGALFTAVQLPDQPAPTDTVSALLDIAKSPKRNVQGLFNLVPASGPFQPSLSASPQSWTVQLQANASAEMPERQVLLGEYLLEEGGGTTATDTSGNGNDGAVVGATWEGSVDLNFTQGSYIGLPEALNAANTWQFAVYSPPFGSAPYPLPSGVGDRSAFGLNPSLLCGSDLAHTCLIASSYPSTVSQQFYSFNAGGTRSSQPLTAGWHIVTLVGGQSGAPDHFYYDGVEVTYASHSTGAFTHPSHGNYQIGGSSIFTGTWFTGKVAAAWAWSSSLSGDDVRIAASNARNLLLAKGVDFTVHNAGHTTPLIIGGTDSRTEGGVWLDELSVSDPSYSVLNLGFYGATLYDHVAMFNLLEEPQILGNTAPTIMIYWGGVNDFVSYPNMPSTVTHASLETLVRRAKADGARVIVATEISEGISEASKADLDTVIRANALSWGADNIADLATIPQLGADGAHTSPVYFMDPVHPNANGDYLIAAVMSNAVNELLGSTASAHHVDSAAQYGEAAGDRFLDLIGAAAQTVTLPSCVGYSLPRQVTNLGNTSATLQTQSGETLSGGSVIPVGYTAVINPVPGPFSTGGCSWHTDSAQPI